MLHSTSRSSAQLRRHQTDPWQLIALGCVTTFSGRFADVCSHREPMVTRVVRGYPGRGVTP